MKKYVFFIIFLLSLSFRGFSQQIDYLEVRDTLTTLSCGVVSIETLYKTEDRLLKFDTMAVTKENLWRYYKDLAWCYYNIWGMTKNEKYAELSIKNYKKTLSHNPEHALAYKDLAIINALLGNCQSMSEYYEKYKQFEQNKKFDKKEFSKLLKVCDNINSKS